MPHWISSKIIKTCKSLLMLTKDWKSQKLNKVHQANWSAPKFIEAILIYIIETYQTPLKLDHLNFLKTSLSIIRHWSVFIKIALGNLQVLHLPYFCNLYIGRILIITVSYVKARRVGKLKSNALFENALCKYFFKN